MQRDVSLVLSLIGLLAFLIAFLRRMAVAPDFYVTEDSYALIGLAFFLGTTLMGLCRNRG